jgi:hypothetical protein
MGEAMPVTRASRWSLLNSVRETLERLLSSDETAFVTIEPMSTGKFVQFVGSARAGLTLDLPVSELDDLERQRAQAYFQQVGGQVREWYDDPFEDEEEFSPSFSFVLELGRDVHRAAQVSVEIFEQIYVAAGESWSEAELRISPHRRATPEHNTVSTGEPGRRTEVTWTTQQERDLYRQLKDIADSETTAIEDVIKRMLRRALSS